MEHCQTVWKGMNRIVSHDIVCYVAWNIKEMMCFEIMWNIVISYGKKWQSVSQCPLGIMVAKYRTAATLLMKWLHEARSTKITTICNWFSIGDCVEVKFNYSLTTALLRALQNDKFHSPHLRLYHKGYALTILLYIFTSSI